MEGLKDGLSSDWYVPSSQEGGNGERREGECGLAGEGITAVRGQLVACGGKWRPIDAVFIELGKEFEGEAPAHSKVRGLLEEVLQECRDLAEKNQST